MGDENNYLTFKTLVGTKCIYLSDPSNSTFRLCYLGVNHRVDCWPVCDPLPAQEKFQGKIHRSKGL